MKLPPPMRSLGYTQKRQTEDEKKVYYVKEHIHMNGTFRFDLRIFFIRIFFYFL